MSSKIESRIVLAFALVVSTTAAAGPTVVIGQNNAALDLPAVQAAVDGGGEVLLVGTFDFGEGRVLVKNDVEIGGETDGRGVALTTIRRGEWSFHTPYPATMPPPIAGPVVSVHHLRFVESRGTAIHLAWSGGCSLHHNVVEQMRARPSGAVLERAAIVVGPSILGGTPATQFVPRLVSGRIEVFDNSLDVSGSEDATRMRGTGMFVAMYVGADVRIQGNLVRENSRTGLAILDGTFDGEGRGSVVIADNTIVSSIRVGFTQGAGPRAPIGIVTGFNNQRALGADPNLVTIPVLIQGNRIELNGVTSMGIINIWNGAILEGNTVVVHADKAATKDRLSTSGGIFATTSRQVLMHNRIIGEGCNAIRIGASMEGGGRFDNVAVGNNISGFSAFVGGFDECVDYWLASDSHDNTVVGNSGTAVDNGTGNKVTGLRSVGGGVGGSVSDAAQAAAQVSQDVEY